MSELASDLALLLPHNPDESRVAEQVTTRAYDERAAGWMGGRAGQTVGRTVGRKDGRTDGRSVGQTDGRAHERTDGYMIGWAHGRTHRQTELWTDGCEYSGQVYRIGAWCLVPTASGNLACGLWLMAYGLMV